MIKKISNVLKPRLFAVAVIDVDLTDPEAIASGEAECLKYGIEAGADYVIAGGNDTRYEDDSVIIISSDDVYADGENEKRLLSLSLEAKTANKPLIYVGASGIRDKGKSVRVYEGGAYAFSSDGSMEVLVPRLEQGRALLDLSSLEETAKPYTSHSNADFAIKVETLIFGTKTFLKRLGIERVVIGISGGIDSAVAAALYGAILPKENVLLVAMPGPFTSQTTRTLGREIAKNLGTRFAEIPIGEAVDLTQHQFSELVSSGPGGGVRGAWELSSFALENVQARDRGSRVLSAAAAAFGGVISCNANKDEITIGYGTLHGDIIGYLSVLGDLWKGEVYKLGRYLNEVVYKAEVIPEGIFQIKPSAELSDNQSVDKGLGDPLVYPYHDKVFKSWVEGETSPGDLLSEYDAGRLETYIGYEGNVAELFKDRRAFYGDLCRWWNLYKGLAVAKRLQAPPVLALSSRAFGEFPEAQSAKRINP